MLYFSLIVLFKYFSKDLSKQKDVDCENPIEPSEQATEYAAASELE